MKKIRNVVSMLVGLTVAVVIFRLGEYIDFLMHPFPDTVDLTDREEVKAYLDGQPQSLWIAILVVWSFGSFAAGYLIKSICKSNNFSLPLIAGCILTVIGTMSIFELPHPVWFTWIAFFMFLPFVLFGFFCAPTIPKKGRKKR